MTPPDDQHDPEEEAATRRSSPGPSRRAMIGTGSVATALGLAGGFTAGRATAAEPTTGAQPSPFALRDEHQPGITTPVQDRLHFAAFDITTTSRARLIALLKEWTLAAERLMAGEPAGEIGPVEGDYRLPPDDTGEAMGLSASKLTLTFGFGPGLFTDEKGTDRFGLGERRPEPLEPLPHFPADMLDPDRSNGDLCIQACADDPQVAVHAIRNLARIGFGTVSMRWSQLGFGRTSSTTTDQATPRNLFGFKDGTKNIHADEPKTLEEHVWVQSQDSGGDWLAGGSYLAVRRINMVVETWDRQGLADQEGFIGRTKATGAPLSGGEEFDEPDFDLAGRDGPIVPKDSHVAVVHPDHNDGVQILRRGYNFVDGSSALGTLDAGLFFLAYVRDPDRQFIPMQTKMAKNDTLMEYLKFTGSALFAIPPGAGEGEYIGQGLFG
ncbi:iron uptake transporter deferrochelatase/peroxidase subunit [Janibacter sp. GS2]|uniref:iron uptake transporter deferrochelatase/peroxidase subunit n=1 Tax=Janibacter sp. GS2 TaxID=3442646 RepID=UPI003EB85D09